jgi:hypothetical protein
MSGGRSTASVTGERRMWLGMAVEHVWMALHGATQAWLHLAMTSALSVRCAVRCADARGPAWNGSQGAYALLSLQAKQVWCLGNVQFALRPGMRSAVPVQTSPQRPKSAPDGRLTSQKVGSYTLLQNAPLRGVWGLSRGFSDTCVLCMDIAFQWGGFFGGLCRLPLPHALFPP